MRSYGLFGEGYYAFNDALKLTVGLRYNNDRKQVRARSTLTSFLVPHGSTDAYSTPTGAGFDADSATACPLNKPDGSAFVGAIGSVDGCEAFQLRKVSFDKWTGRAVLDWKVTPDNLIYASYSRGYKSGGINPPLQPIFEVKEAFAPEIVDAFEIGSKNRSGASRPICALGRSWLDADLQPALSHRLCEPDARRYSKLSSARQPLRGASGEFRAARRRN